MDVLKPALWEQHLGRCLLTENRIGWCIFICLHGGGENQFSSVQSLSRVQLFATPWIAARQASLSITNSRRSLRLTSIESVMPSSHLILCRPLLLLPPIPPSIRVFSSESTLHMRCREMSNLTSQAQIIIPARHPRPSSFISPLFLLPTLIEQHGMETETNRIHFLLYEGHSLPEVRLRT